MDMLKIASKIWLDILLLAIIIADTITTQFLDSLSAIDYTRLILYRSGLFDL